MLRLPPPLSPPPSHCGFVAPKRFAYLRELGGVHDGFFPRVQGLGWVMCPLSWWAHAHLFGLWRARAWERPCIRRFTVCGVVLQLGRGHFVFAAYCPSAVEYLCPYPLIASTLPPLPAQLGALLPVSLPRTVPLGRQAPLPGLLLDICASVSSTGVSAGACGGLLAHGSLRSLAQNGGAARLAGA